MLGAIVDATERLTRFPRMGHLVREASDPSLREIVVDRRHRVFYEIDDEIVTILAVIDAAMDANARLRLLRRGND